MGPERTGIYFHASKATTLSQDFTVRNLFRDYNTCSVQYFINNVYFSPIQIENKPCEAALNVRLILGLLA
jgi:hypothetical protein